MGTDIRHNEACPSHPEASLVEDYRAGDQICCICGFVVGDRVIDVGREWRTFSNNDGGEALDPSRVGAAQYSLDNELDLSTVIRPSCSRSVTSGGGNTFTRYPRPTMTHSQRTTANALDLIKNMAERMNLSKVIVDRARTLFNQVHDAKHLKGRSKNALASACLYISCRKEDAPRSFKEICSVSNVKKEEIGRCFKMTLKTIDTFNDIKATDEFTSRFGPILGLPIVVQRAAGHIARKAIDLELVVDRAPISVATAAIFMASQVSDETWACKKTLKEIADVSKIAVVTIRTSYKLMRPRAAELFPEGFHFPTPIELLPQF